MFILAVNYFGVKHLSKINADYLVQALKEKHEDVEVNLEGDKICGISLKVDHTNRMPTQRYKTHE